MSISIVVPTRNDDWGAVSRGDLARRAAVALACMLGVADELVLVDLNSQGPPLITTLPPAITSHQRLLSVVVDHAECALLKNASCGIRFFETLARNVGIRAATSDFIASSNIDVLPPPKAVVNMLIRSLHGSWKHAFILSRHEYFKWLDDTHLRGFCSPTDPSCYSDAHYASSAAGRLATAHNWTRELKWRRNISLASLRSLPQRPHQALNYLSLVNNCGDFQLASRKLWHMVAFSEALQGRDFADTLLQVEWLNTGATLLVPSNVWVLHLSHIHPHPRHSPRLWKTVHWNKMPHFVLEQAPQKHISIAATLI
mmetsp:Transcript_14674/g.24448  ORF Transcript_14674/g.24448 Transcript_14674/m.24448 type:complete len:313 (+) Transcript_14674:25-963(+)